MVAQMSERRDTAKLLENIAGVLDKGDILVGDDVSNRRAGVWRNDTISITSIVSRPSRTASRQRRCRFGESSVVEMFEPTILFLQLLCALYIDTFLRLHLAIPTMLYS